MITIDLKKQRERRKKLSSDVEKLGNASQFSRDFSPSKTMLK